MVTITATVTTPSGERCARTHTLGIVAVDLDIDSDNNDRFEPPARSDAEDAAELGSGIKVLIVNRDDTDGDGVPDYADGYGLFGLSTSGGVAGERFVPIVIDWPGLTDASGAVLRLAYSAAEDIGHAEVPIPDFHISYDRYVRGAGHLRVWRHDGWESRAPTDFVRPGEDIPLDAAGDSITLYVEAINGAPIALPITATLILSDGRSVTDTVRVLPFDSVSGLAEDEIDGYTIVRDSPNGTRGNDIIIAKPTYEFMVGGDGDDIYVSNAGARGSMIVFTGSGANVVYASHGKVTIAAPSPPAAITAGPEAISLNSNLIFNEDDGPFTTDQVLVIYRLFHGENDAWLEAYERVGGKIQVVDSDGAGLVLWDWSASDWDWIQSGGEQFPLIQLEFDLGRPALAAAHLRQQLTDFAGHPAYGAGFRTELASILLFERAKVAEFLDDPAAVQTVLDLQRAAFQNAVEYSAAITNLYASSVGIASEAADIVITVGQFASGQADGFDLALAFVPFVSSPIVDSIAIGRKSLIRADTGERVLARGGGDVVLDRRALWSPGGSGPKLGVIPRPDMWAFRESRTINGKTILLLGIAQETGNPNHGIISRYLASVRFADEQSEFILMNRSLKTATGRTDLGAVSGWRSDMVVVRRGDGTGGKVDLYEVQSDSDRIEDLIDKLNAMWISLPPAFRGRLYLYDKNGVPIDFPGGTVGPAIPPELLVNQ